MAHEERRNMSKNTDASLDNRSNEQKSALEQLADANHEIEELKLQIAWLERSYEWLLSTINNAVESNFGELISFIQNSTYNFYLIMYQLKKDKYLLDLSFFDRNDESLLFIFHFTYVLAYIFTYFIIK